MIFETDLRYPVAAVTGIAHFSCVASRLFAVLSDPSSWAVENSPRITASTAHSKIVFSLDGEIRVTANLLPWHHELTTLELVIEGFDSDTSREFLESYWGNISEQINKRLSGPDIRVASSPAKVNVFFAVGALKKDGFHDVASCYQALSLRERVAVELTGRFSIGFAGDYATQCEKFVPKDQTNLVYRAAVELADNGSGIDPALVAFWIRKSVPIAGGMAGGSADGAAALVALNALSKAGLDKNLLRYAAKLGSDIPFALMGGTAVGLGRGEKLTAIANSAILHWVMTPSEQGLSTPEVYRKLDVMRLEAGVNVSKISKPTVPQELLDSLETGDTAVVAEQMHNDLEIAALALRPELAETIEKGRKAGALRSMVSGSGPTIAHLAKDRVHAEQIANRLGSSGLPSIATYTSVSGTYLEN